jgi:DNA-binding response OmpR family regulator
MGYRREERVPLQVPALVSGLDRGGRAFIQSAKTLDISTEGARITGLNCQLDPGSILSIQLGNRKARFEVLWIGAPGTPREGEIGLKCIEIGTQNRKRVLYVDDQEHELEARRGMLEAAGFEVACVLSARDAMEYMKSYGFDAIVLDFPLYDVDCTQFVQNVRLESPETRVILLSGYPTRIPEILLAESDAFIHKGEPRQKLLTVLDEMIGSSSVLKWPVARVSSRFAIRVPLDIKVFRFGHLVIIPGRSTDLNEFGMGAKLDLELVPGEMVTLEFRLPMADDVFRPRATVRRRSNSCHYGLEFVSIDPLQRARIRELCEVLPPLDVPQGV